MTDDMMNLRALVEKSADADLLREMISFAAQKLMEMEVGAATAPPGARSRHGGPPSNGYRTGTGRGVGTVELRIPVGEGIRLPGFLERRAAEGADGRHPGASASSISTRSVDDLVKAMGMADLEESQVVGCARRSTQGEGLPRVADRGRLALPVDRRHLPEGPSCGRIVSVAVIIAVGVNSDGRREVLGMEIGTSEAEPWTEFLRNDAVACVA
ncbi:MAG: transposase [Aquamicrobium sp.]|uniref:transposase n=1 Tax=Aquamicrobium sp. TaxID=1872579 RepID=UPI00349EB729|nr:transposase [Aquamicrobium sp.]